MKTKVVNYFLSEDMCLKIRITFHGNKTKTHTSRICQSSSKGCMHYMNAWKLVAVRVVVWMKSLTYFRIHSE